MRLGTWIHHFEPESTRESIDCAIPPHHARRSSNLSSMQEKVMVTVFWDSVGVKLVGFMSKGATINSDVYIDKLKKLKARIQRVPPALEMS